MHLSVEQPGTRHRVEQMIHGSLVDYHLLGLHGDALGACRDDGIGHVQEEPMLHHADRLQHLEQAMNKDSYEQQHAERVYATAHGRECTQQKAVVSAVELRSQSDSNEIYPACMHVFFSVQFVRGMITHDPRVQ